MSKVRFHVRHDTHYAYDQPVGESRQMLRLTPRELPWQKTLSHRLQIDPEPTRQNAFVDAFGNPVLAIDLRSDHESLTVRAEGWIELAARCAEPRESPPWKQVREALAYVAGKRYDAELMVASQFCFESRHVRVKREFAAYAAACFDDDCTLLEGSSRLMERIFEDFTFDPEATTVSTPVTEVFENKRGVCQDYAHFMVSCLRSIGLAARYVSGYLLTHPAPGKPRLVGADATHAWVALFCPRNGWIEFDPTNKLRPELEHIILGWGRDFADVSPLRGVLLGGGSHDPGIEVSVVPEEEFEDFYRETDDAPAPLLPGIA